MRGHRLWLGSSNWTLGKKSSAALNRLSCLKGPEKSNWIRFNQRGWKISNLDFFQTWLGKDTAYVTYDATSRR